MLSNMLHVCVCALSHSVVSDSLWLNGFQSTSLSCAWNFPVKITRVGCQISYSKKSSNSGIELVSPVLEGRFFTTKPRRSSNMFHMIFLIPGLYFKRRPEVNSLLEWVFPTWMNIVNILADFEISWSCSKQGQLAHLKGPLGVQLVVLGGRTSDSFGLASRVNLNSNKEEIWLSSMTAPGSQMPWVLKTGWISIHQVHIPVLPYNCQKPEQ